MKVIGLTGGVASGKSTASRYIAQNGLPVLDADVVAREVVQPGMPALKEIVDTFGAHMLLSTGELDRKALGRHVFNDAQELLKLNKIVHPRIRERLLVMLKHIEESKTYPAAIVDAALLLETQWEDLVDEVWVIVVTQEVQCERLMARNGIGLEDAMAIINAQMPTSKKMAKAHIWIDNSKKPVDMYHQLDELIMTIM